MSGYLLDTNVPSELSKPRPSAEVIDWMRSAPQFDLYLSAITIAELTRGIQRHPDPVRRERLEEWYTAGLQEWFSTEVLAVTERIAAKAGSLQALQEGRGHHLSLPDALIAATALLYDLVLVTRNTRDFTDMGLRLIEPWQPMR